MGFLQTLQHHYGNIRKAKLEQEFKWYRHVSSSDSYLERELKELGDIGWLVMELSPNWLRGLIGERSCFKMFGILVFGLFLRFFVCILQNCLPFDFSLPSCMLNPDTALQEAGLLPVVLVPMTFVLYGSDGIFHCPLLHTPFPLLIRHGLFPLCWFCANPGYNGSLFHL